MVPVSVHGKTKAGRHEQGVRHVRRAVAATSPTRSSGCARSPRRTWWPRSTTRRSARHCCRTGRSSPRRTPSAWPCGSTRKLRLADRHPVVHNLVISNVPGPPMPIYFIGARDHRLLSVRPGVPRRRPEHHRAVQRRPRRRRPDRVPRTRARTCGTLAEDLPIALDRTAQGRRANDDAHRDAEAHAASSAGVNRAASSTQPA